MIGYLNGLGRKHRVIQLCVRKEKSRTSIVWVVLVRVVYDLVS